MAFVVNACYDESIKDTEMRAMDDLMARTMVENLSKGINPFTGEDVPDTDLCANEEVQNALKFVLAYCSLESYEQILKRQYNGEKPLKEKIAPWEKNTKRTTVARKKRREWTKEEDEGLYRLYLKNCSDVLIAKVLDRTPDEVRKRINWLFSWMK